MVVLNNKAVTCHAGARDAYQLSIALEDAKLLEYLVTDIFLPPFLGKKIKKRFTENLSYDHVKTNCLNFLIQWFLKTPYTDTDKILTSRALQIALTNNANLFLYSYTANEAFDFIKKNGLTNKCFLFQLHPHPLSIKKLLLEEISLSPLAVDSLMSESEMRMNEMQVKCLTNESIYADKIIVASSYTKKTLIENNISAEKISIIPYGVDSTKFSQKIIYNEKNGEIKLLFIGQMIQRKGLTYLFEAIKLLKSKNIILTLIGRGFIDYNLIAEYKKYFDITIKVNLKHEDLVTEMHNHDMLIFPSLVEGFAHVILESMSVGLPVLCTPNTCGPDIFLNGNEGVIVPIRNSFAIAEQIEYFINNKNELAFMGKSAGKTARIFTWQKFRDEIIQFYIENTK